MTYRHNIQHCLESEIGKEGANDSRYHALLKQSAGAREKILAAMQQGKLPALTLSEESGDLAAIQSAGKDILKNFRKLIVLATGGSVLGGHTLASLHTQGFCQSPVQFVDTVDPHSFAKLLEGIDWKHTCFLAISKSGETLETLAQALICLKAAEEKLGASYRNHFRFITMPGPRPLRELGEAHGIPMMEHDPKVGGRFSVLSLVGLIPAFVAGVNIEEVRRGAAEVLQQFRRTTAIEDIPSLCGAVLHLALTEKNKRIHVMMPYADRLQCFTHWHKQLWAESLGKEGYGTTPVTARGTFDQHSQQQLYLEGPRDKFYSFILTDCRRKGPEIHGKKLAATDYLLHHHLGTIFAAEQRGTVETLIKTGAPVRIFELQEVNERALGALIMHMMLETIATAHLLGIDAFDQPAVEAGKKLALEYLQQDLLPG